MNSLYMNRNVFNFRYVWVVSLSVDFEKQIPFYCWCGIYSFGALFILQKFNFLNFFPTLTSN